jgi:hypothetical protein
MDNEQMKYLLCALLGCGTSDLSLIGDTTLGWSDIIDRAKGREEEISLGSMFNAIVDLGKNNLKVSIDMRISDLQGEDQLTEEETAELDSLEKLNVEQDISTYFNFLDTHVNFINNEEVYRKYLSDQIDTFEDETGFNLQ